VMPSRAFLRRAATEMPTSVIRRSRGLRGIDQLHLSKAAPMRGVVRT
jgi:hypothetical protein